MFSRLRIPAFLACSLLAGVLMCAEDGADKATAPAPVVKAAPQADAKADQKVDPVWLTNLKQAQEIAKKDNKQILAACIGSDWCPFCEKLEAEVFKTDAFKTWAAKKFVLVTLDYPENKELDAATTAQNRDFAEKYEIEKFPTVVFLDADLKEVGRIGYKKGGPEVWLPAADAVLTKPAADAAKPVDPPAATGAGAPATAGQVPAHSVTATTTGAAGAMAATVTEAKDEGGGCCSAKITAVEPEVKGAMAGCKAPATAASTEKAAPVDSCCGGK